MKTTIILAAATLTTCLVFADSATNAPSVAPSPGVPSASKKINKKLFATGGRIIIPGSQKGKLVYVNAQNRADRAWLENSAKDYMDLLRFQIEIKDAVIDNPDFNTCRKFMMDNGLIIAVFLIDREDDGRTLAIYPEQGFSVVNIAQLGKGVKPKFFEMRVRKELHRGLAAICGAFGSQFEKSILAGTRTPEDLDQAFDDQIPFDAIQRFPPYLAKFGISPLQFTSYRQACREGWAPAPTNEYQKAVWDREHQLPDKPIQIKFDPKAKK